MNMVQVKLQFMFYFIFTKKCATIWCSDWSLSRHFNWWNHCGAAFIHILLCGLFITFKPSENKNPNTQNILNADCSIIQPNVCATRCTIWNYVTFSSNLSFGTKLVGKFFFIHLRCACSYFIFRLTRSENQLHCKFVSFVYFVFIYKVFNLCEKNAKEKHNQTPSTISKALRVCTIRKIIKKMFFFRCVFWS